jgi:hypothetical protein
MTPGAMAMRHASDSAFVLLALLVGFPVAACSEGNGAAECLPEDVQRCHCEDGREGYRVCSPDGSSAYGACDCDLDASPYLPQLPADDGGAGEGDGATEGGAGGGDAGLMFLSPCDPGDDQCPPNTSCDAFPAKGPHCSKPCTVATDCPMPSPGCNMMGVCKAP